MKIEQAKELPSRIKYPFGKIEVGEAMVLENISVEDAQRVRAALRGYKFRNPGYHAITRRIDGHLYINRIA